MQVGRAWPGKGLLAVAPHWAPMCKAIWTEEWPSGGGPELGLQLWVRVRLVLSLRVEEAPATLRTGRWAFLHMRECTPICTCLQVCVHTCQRFCWCEFWYVQTHMSAHLCLCMCMNYLVTYVYRYCRVHIWMECWVRPKNNFWLDPVVRFKWRVPYTHIGRHILIYICIHRFWQRVYSKWWISFFPK